ncbi:MAG TPA: response regulator [Candidatus Omnitrophota bacterium]|nr:response regulator [Candidatus Omnitrophota bacterium]HPS37262.1 response regulator [Candidatus Omnitrophota bacterium]
MGRKILIVEDDTDFQDIYTLYLQGESFEVLKAGNGQEGLAILEKEIPDLIILDLIMPVMDGEEFYVRLRAQEKWKRIPVIIASVNEKIPHRVAELGNVSDVLKKPFDVEVLLQKIRKHLK